MQPLSLRSMTCGTCTLSTKTIEEAELEASKLPYTTIKEQHGMYAIYYLAMFPLPSDPTISLQTCKDLLVDLKAAEAKIN